MIKVIKEKQILLSKDKKGKFELPFEVKFNEDENKFELSYVNFRKYSLSSDELKVLAKYLDELNN